ncbi:MAG: outer membrane beta-barrel protein [Candidatus Paceibacterota bacterium]
MKKILILIIGLFSTQLISADYSFAQWGIGAGVEIRDEDPTTGVGIKLERELLSKAPIVDLNLRGHFSWFSDENAESIYPSAIITPVDVYDYGAALVFGVKLGLVKPYVGAGIGTERYSEENNSMDNFYWNGLGGAEITLLPFLKPFIEFRYSKLVDTDEIRYDNYNRLAIGVNFRF